MLKQHNRKSVLRVIEEESSTTVCDNTLSLLFLTANCAIEEVGVTFYSLVKCQNIE